MTTSSYLIAAAEDQGGRGNRIAQPGSLTTAGIAAARRCAPAITERIGEDTPIWCSPSPSCRESGLVWFPASRLCTAPALAERYMGTWNGEYLQNLDPLELAAFVSQPDFTPEGGETLSDVNMRLQQWLSDVDIVAHPAAIIVSPTLFSHLFNAVLGISAVARVCQAGPLHVAQIGRIGSTPVLQDYRCLTG